VKIRFQNLPFKFNLQRYTAVKQHRILAAAAVAAEGAFHHLAAGLYMFANPAHP
jgi:hypothetical protein